MERSANPTIAGSFNLIVGSIVSVIALVLLIDGIIAQDDPYRNSTFIVFALLIPPGILAIVGGIHALRRKRWSLALVCSMFTIPIGSLLTIPAVILIAVSKKEFDNSTSISTRTAVPLPDTATRENVMPEQSVRQRLISVPIVVAILLGSLELCFGLLGGLLILITDRGWRAYPIADSVIAISLIILGDLAVILGVIGIDRKNRKWAVSGIVCAVVEILVIVLLWVYR